MSNGVLERLTALRRRLAVLRDGTQSERVRACTVKDMALIEEAEEELARLQGQANWAVFQESGLPCRWSIDSRETDGAPGPTWPPRRRPSGNDRAHEARSLPQTLPVLDAGPNQLGANLMLAGPASFPGPSSGP